MVATHGACYILQVQENRSLLLNSLYEFSTRTIEI
jgi:hypothetical protein